MQPPQAPQAPQEHAAQQRIPSARRRCDTMPLDAASSAPSSTLLAKQELVHALSAEASATSLLLSPPLIPPFRFAIVECARPIIATTPAPANAAAAPPLGGGSGSLASSRSGSTKQLQLQQQSTPAAAAAAQSGSAPSAATPHAAASLSSAANASLPLNSMTSIGGAGSTVTLSSLTPHGNSSSGGGAGGSGGGGPALTPQRERRGSATLSSLAVIALAVQPGGASSSSSSSTTASNSSTGGSLSAASSSAAAAAANPPSAASSLASSAAPAMPIGLHKAASLTNTAQLSSAAAAPSASPASSAAAPAAAVGSALASSPPTSPSRVHPPSAAVPSAAAAAGAAVAAPSGPDVSLYRGAYPTLKNFHFLSRLRLRSIVSLTPEPPSADIRRFCNSGGSVQAAISLSSSSAVPCSALPSAVTPAIRLFHLPVSKYNENVSLTVRQVVSALQILCNADNLPAYVHCLDGLNNTSLVIACLRKLQCWAPVGIFCEYLRFTREVGGLIEQEKQFIDRFNHGLAAPPLLTPGGLAQQQLPQQAQQQKNKLGEKIKSGSSADSVLFRVPLNLPSWLWGGSHLCVHPLGIKLFDAHVPAFAVLHSKLLSAEGGIAPTAAGAAAAAAATASGSAASSSAAAGTPISSAAAALGAAAATPSSSSSNSSSGSGGASGSGTGSSSNSSSWKLVDEEECLWSDAADSAAQEAASAKEKKKKAEKEAKKDKAASSLAATPAAAAGAAAGGSSVPATPTAAALTALTDTNSADGTANAPGSDAATAGTPSSLLTVGGSVRAADAKKPDAASSSSSSLSTKNANSAANAGMAPGEEKTGQAALQSAPSATSASSSAALAGADAATAVPPAAAAVAAPAPSVPAPSPSTSAAAAAAAAASAQQAPLSHPGEFHSLIDLEKSRWNRPISWLAADLIFVPGSFHVPPQGAVPPSAAQQQQQQWTAAEATLTSAEIAAGALTSISDMDQTPFVQQPDEPEEQFTVDCFDSFVSPLVASLALEGLTMSPMISRPMQLFQGIAQVSSGQTKPLADQAQA